ncbi:type VII secretion target [Mycobacterium xenopi]|uniref:type VII secretion target n=1 Tax=Mycobacterium xenopi TaxID=1789 RepID=UPI000A150B7F|nr:type VII secretion target [Mycobacterium xenopi]ORX13061.1 hypothetical protein AWC32_15645 [Mycobacterium xenopi]SPX94945.1 Protein of uncharacterised function (DUF2580) [Mycobacterium xenopi]
MAELNVNPADLLQVADAYDELATRAALMSPQAVVEVRRIAQTHGPMGYPTAVGITAGLAAREPAVSAKAADFTVYSQRFTDHAAAYTSTDADAADPLDALAFEDGRPTAHVAPKPPPEKPWAPCWIGSPEANVPAICPPDTTDVYYFDKDGNLVSRDVGTGATKIIDHPGMNPPPEAPGDCYLPSADADRSICAPGTDQWIYPGPGGSEIHESVVPPGSDRRYFTIQPPGPMGPGDQTVIRPGGTASR